MAYCPPALLDDLAEVLAEVRAWAGVVEKKPGVFYVRRQPFLHFHLVRDTSGYRGGPRGSRGASERRRVRGAPGAPQLQPGWRRRADVKGRTAWAQLDLPRPASAARRRALLRELRARHREK
ncbi:MAG: hypothetical protein HYR86_12080 [Candidatus Rokubacteria bacterium]|nr:hypothetical protein [Candidatus Rokubacteria bacterium]